MKISDFKNVYCHMSEVEVCSSREPMKKAFYKGELGDVPVHMLEWEVHSLIPYTYYDEEVNDEEICMIIFVEVKE